MKEFMMIFRNEKQPAGEMPSAEQMQAVMKQWQNWIGGIAAQGKYSGTGHCLPPRHYYKSTAIPTAV